MSELAPKQGYYPSAKLKLTIRFEEFKRALAPAAPKKTARNLKGITVPRAELTVETEKDASGFSRFVLKGTQSNSGTRVAPDGKSTSSPNAPRESLPENTASVLGIIPQSATLKQNGPRIADTLSVTIRWEDFPLNPLAIRATAVEFYLGTVTAENYARGMRGETKEVRVGDAVVAEPLNMVPDYFISPDDQKRYENLRFQGWVDKFEVEFNEGVTYVKLECTDNTRLFMDQPAPPNLRIDTKKPVEEAIAQYLAHFPQFEGITVQYLPEEEAGKVFISQAMAKPLYPPKLGPAPAGGGGGEDMAVLDYLVQVVGTLAHTVRIEGTNVLIQKSNSLVGGKRRPRPSDSYSPRRVGDTTFPYRTLVYGWNLQSLKYNREFSGRAPKNFEVRSYNPAKKTMVVGRYPKKGDRVISLLPGGKADDKWNVQVVKAGLSQEQVNEIAKQSYEATARTELTVSCKTKNLASYGGSNENPDLLDLVTGDPIAIFLDKSEATSSVATADASMSAASSGQRKLLGLGYSENFAKLYADARSNTKMPNVFYTREVSTSWSIDSGVDVEVEACNYIEARLEGKDSENQ